MVFFLFGFFLGLKLAQLPLHLTLYHYWSVIPQRPFPSFFNPTSSLLFCELPCFMHWSTLSLDPFLFLSTNFPDSER